MSVKRAEALMAGEGETAIYADGLGSMVLVVLKPDQNRHHKGPDAMYLTNHEAERLVTALEAALRGWDCE